MPKIYTTLSNIQQSVIRPVIYGVIEQVKAITKIKKNALVLFPGDSGVNSTPGSTMDEDKNREAMFSTTNIIEIEVQYDHDEEDITSTDAYGRHTYPIFKDTKLGVYLTPVYSKTNVTINFKYRTPSKTEAMRWRDDMRNKLSQMRDMNLHSVDYSYTIPMVYLVLLKEIHTRREAVAGYGEDFVNYIKLHATDALTLVSDVVGQDTALVVAETQSRIVGLYEFSPLPEKPEKDNENSIWVINFSYKFSFDQPVVASMKYPLMIHNQPLPLEYLDFKEHEISNYDKNHYVDGRLNGLNYFEIDSTLNRNFSDKLFIRIPEFDDYVLKNSYGGTCTIFLSLCQIDEGNPKLLLDFKDLGELAIEEDIFQFMKESEAPYMCKPYMSIFNISLYRGDGLIEYSALSCNGDLEVYLANDPKIRLEHRVRFSIVADLSLLHPDALARLKKWPWIFKKLLAVINKYIGFHPDFNEIGKRGRITDLEFNIMYKLFTGKDTMRLDGKYDRRNLFADIDPRKVREHINNTIQSNAIQFQNILSFKREEY